MSKRELSRDSLLSRREFLKDSLAVTGASSALISTSTGAQRAKEQNVLIAPGKPLPRIVRGSGDTYAAGRLAKTLEDLTGSKIRIIQYREALSQGDILVGSAQSDSGIAALVKRQQPSVKLEPEGFLIKTLADSKPLLLIAGADRVGTIYGVNELVNFYLESNGKTAWVPSLSIQESPALRFRILWTWDHRTNWTLGVRGLQEQGAHNPYMKSPQTFVEDYKKVIDFMSNHKLNGLIIWGFLRDIHGGVGAGQELVQYANERGVHILPGVGTEYYGGFYYEGNHQFNVDTWLSNNPTSLRFLNAKGKRLSDGICPSKGTNQQWLREGARWLFSTFPGLGGVNLENGDFMSCQTEDCQGAREQATNDPNYYWDMMKTQVPIIEVARKINPEAWFTYATYTGFTKADIWSRTPQGQLRGEVPRFPGQFPEQAVCQWTLTRMVSKPSQAKPDPALWPRGVRPPTQRSVGLLHQGSVVWKGSHWWCATSWGNDTGGRYDEILDILSYTARRCQEEGLEGLEIMGGVSPSSPQNELNYFALEEFGWHPNRSMDDFIENRLSRFYGGRQLAKQFVNFVTSDVDDPDLLIKHYGQSREIAADRTLSSAQRERWSNLAREIARRLSLLGVYGKR